VSAEEFLHTLTPAESDALEDVGEPRAANSLLELLSRRLRESEAGRVL